MPGLFEQPTGMPAPKGQSFGVGAFRPTRSYRVSALKTLLPHILGQRKDASEKRREDYEFEMSLNTSGLSEDQKQRARLYRHAPQVARVLDEADARKERETFTREMAAEKTAAKEADVKRKAEEAAAKEEQKRMGKEVARDWARENVRTEYLPNRFATGLPTAQPQKIRLPGMVGGDINTGVSKVQIKPDMPPSLRQWLTEQDPSSPALVAATQAEFNQRQVQFQSEQAEAKKKQDEIARKAAIEKQKEDDAAQAIETEFAEYPETLARAKNKVAAGGKASVVIEQERKTMETHRKSLRDQARKDEEKARALQKEADARHLKIVQAQEEGKLGKTKPGTIEEMSKLQTKAAEEIEALKRRAQETRLRTLTKRQRQVYEALLKKSDAGQTTEEEEAIIDQIEGVISGDDIARAESFADQTGDVLMAGRGTPPETKGGGNWLAPGRIA